MIQDYKILGKGDFNIMADVPGLTGVEASDVKYCYGAIQFKGTKKQLDILLAELYKTVVVAVPKAPLKLLADIVSELKPSCFIIAAPGEEGTPAKRVEPLLLFIRTV